MGTQYKKESGSKKVIWIRGVSIMSKNYNENRVLGIHVTHYHIQFGCQVEKPGLFLDQDSRDTNAHGQGHGFLEQRISAKNHPKLVQSNQLAAINPDNTSVNPAKMKPETLRKCIDKAVEKAPTLNPSLALQHVPEYTPQEVSSPTPFASPA